MEKIRALLGKKWNSKRAGETDALVKNFSYTEKALFYGLIIIFSVSSLSLVGKVSDAFSVEVPAHAGTLTEGIIGSPRFINPLLAVSDADKDLTALIYSGLLKEDQNGVLVPDLAESYSVSPNGLVYTFILKKGLTFHDGHSLTVDDILFTISKAQDRTLKSPKRVNWDGVTVEKINDREIHFTLKQSYAPFLENATLGILPKHLWKDSDAEKLSFNSNNIQPIGSGPYKISTITKDDNGLPSGYTLGAFSNYALGKAYISKLILKFYGSEDALFTAYKNKEIQSTSALAPERALEFISNGGVIEKIPLSRIFGVFFNQNQAPLLADSMVRKALLLAVDKKEIIDSVLKGYATPIDGPIPAKSLSGILHTTEEEAKATESDTTSAITLLEKAGWKLNTETGIREKKIKKETEILTFSLATSNAPELKKTAELLKKDWQRIGVSVDLKIFESGDLNQNVIRPRKYDALLFGEVIGRDLDLFAFWHSSQRNDPGLNIALYTNIKTDKLLEDARSATDKESRALSFDKFEDEISKDTPAIFLYSPDFIYVLPEQVAGFEEKEITAPSERFGNISKWYVEQDKVWNIFSKK